jgi:hypothetical protein
MTTKYQIIRTDGTMTNEIIDWPREPGYDAIAELIRPLIGGAHLEHVSVLHNGGRRDMFVDENGHAKNLPFNEKATAIYRHNWLTQRPKTDPASLAWIVGTAILFPDQIIWA